jgi:hypothetical protein
MGSWVRKALAALFALSLVAAPAASAQDLRDYLQQQVDNSEPNVAEDGYARAAGPLAGRLINAGAASLPMTFRSGQEIRIVGVCDQRCSALDLRVLDPGGRMIAHDGGGSPSIDIRPVITGQYTIEVGMTRCDAPNCRYAVTVYTR